MEPVKMTAEMAKKIREYLVQVDEVRKSLSNYLNGLRDGMGLSDDYYVDIATMSFVPKKEEEKNDGPGM